MRGQLSLTKPTSVAAKTGHWEDVVTEVRVNGMDENETLRTRCAELERELRDTRNEIIERQYNIWAPLQVRVETAERERDALRQVLVELREWADYHRPNRIWADQVSDEIDRRLAALEREEPKP